jgi:hypothetical protein
VSFEYRINLRVLLQNTFGGDRIVSFYMYLGYQRFCRYHVASDITYVLDWLHEIQNSDVSTRGNGSGKCHESSVILM